MVSVERLKQFSEIPSEAEWRKMDFLPPSSWPSRGNVELENVQVIILTNSVVAIC